MKTHLFGLKLKNKNIWKPENKKGLVTVWVESAYPKQTHYIFQPKTTDDTLQLDSALA